MKKIFIIFISFFIITNISYACKIVELGKEIPKEFNNSCYMFTGELEPQLEGIDLGNGVKCLGYQTFKVNSPKKIETFISKEMIIPFKLYKKSSNNINYNINLEGNIDYLKDNNNKTFLTYDTTQNNEIIIKLDKLLKSDTYYFDFIFESNNFKAIYKKSHDGKKYYEVEKNKIKDYDVQYLKINFISKTNNIKHEKIKIKQLNFKTEKYEYLIKTRGSIEAYSDNRCKNNNSYLGNNIGDFDLNINTKNLNLELITNWDFDVISPEDKDNDGIVNSKDNCISIANPLQKDKNGDGKGDMCSDDDKDGIIGNKDNCPYIYNPKQTDININKVGDLCEFDKDSDGIFDSFDNCINKYNPNQYDHDYDGIGDECDNCMYFNPKQIDKNNNKIGDVCEQKKQYLQENDSDKDGIIDYSDNCKEISNPNQEDIDKDGIGDICDNCVNIQNKNQLDLNKNGKGDICEDSDGDGIDGITDNCINTPNTDQKDSDNNGVGDACEDSDGDKIIFINDNCPYKYNPDQSDIDGDKIGDRCDDSDDRFIESNKTIFIILLLVIVAAFGFAIWRMVKKLK